MTYAEEIIQKFGGVRAAAVALGFPPSTVMGWKKRGTIPDEQKPGVLEASNRLGLGLSPIDFWPGKSNPQPPEATP